MTEIKPQPNKVPVILAIILPKQVKDLGMIYGIGQYYSDLWARHSGMLVQLSSLAGECSHIKVSRAKKTKK